MGDDSELHSRLDRLARAMRMVFLAGLPGTGKSLFVHRLAHLAHAAGRVVHLVQWDLVRPVFEACPAGRRYPMVEGVTHVVIRKAAGAWARGAVARWQERHAGPEHLLIGETPLVGHRFIELARRMDDPAEPLLSAPSCGFVIPVPSRDVRRFLEAERDRRTRRRVHEREREDAPPSVVRGLWGEVVNAARRLGIEAPAGRGGDVPYDPVLYERVYRRVLVHRRVERLSVTRVLPDAAASVYAFAVPAHELAPAPEEATALIRAVEAQSPDPGRLEDEAARWYEA